MLQRVVDGDKGRVRGCPVAKPQVGVGMGKTNLEILSRCGELSRRIIDKLI
jgi:hypothetical protein